MTMHETDERAAGTAADVDQVVALMRAAAPAYIGGDMRRFFDLIETTGDFTLMSPFGGDVSREGSEAATPERLAALEAYFQGGDCELEVVETYASGDLVVLVAVERQVGVVGGLPEQDWSLRVTLVLRRTPTGWALAHRHADALVHPIELPVLAALARGDAE